MRRVPIVDPPLPVPDSPGQHRPETVIARLRSDRVADLRRLAELSLRMADLDAVLSRLDNVVAVAADVRASVLADVTGQVESRVAELETALGVVPPVDPAADQPAA